MATLKQQRREAVFRALADPTRRKILGLLRGRACTVSEMAANFSTSRPAISKHLRILRQVGLVQTRREGTSRICRLNAEPLRVVDAWLRDYR
jgi:DNA-binding transcriptional ArsR family regulator